MNYAKTTDFPIADAARFFRESKGSLRFEDSSPSFKRDASRPASSRPKNNKMLSMEFI